MPKKMRTTRWIVQAALVIVGFQARDHSSVQADSLDAIRQRGVLRWGGDAEGGGPFVFPRADNPAQYQGFEVELADLLANKLGVQPQFVQGPWDKLPELLNRGEIDVVLNGYEWKPTWTGRYGTTLPYYVYQLQWMVRSDDKRLQQLSDFRSAVSDKPRVAVLAASAAELHVRQEFGDTVEIVLFEGATDAMRAVELNIDGIDATVQDLPVVTFYSERFPQLRKMGDPTAAGYYVALTQWEEMSLTQALNSAILDSWRDGSIPAILERYGMWNDMQRHRGLIVDERGNFQLDPTPPKIPTEPHAASPHKTTLNEVWLRIPMLFQGAVMTVFLSVTAMPLAILVGLSIATGRLYAPPIVRWVLALYVELIRGTPLVLQLYVIFFLLPEFGISLPALVAAILGLAVNYSAYEAEIYRAGLQAVPRGQTEAALSLGMSRWQTLYRIVIPQAVRIVIPPVLNDFIALFKDTAVCSVITVVELSKQYYIHAQSTGAVVELAVVTGLFYLAMSYPLALVVGKIERQMANGTRHD